MFMMALSLSITAGGSSCFTCCGTSSRRRPARTLNAVVFGDISQPRVSWACRPALLTIVLVSSGALLFVAGIRAFWAVRPCSPTWLPTGAGTEPVRRTFFAPRNRNGVLLMGAAELAILAWTEGQVALLVVLYTVNVFITFTLALLGLTNYWWKRRHDQESKRRLLLSSLALVITAAILVVIIVERFMQGGIVTLGITSCVVAAGLLIRRHYSRIRVLTQQFERNRRWLMRDLGCEPPVLDLVQPTAVFLVSSNRGIGVHTVERVEALFPGHFKNFVSSPSHRRQPVLCSEPTLRTLQYETRSTLDALVNFVLRRRCSTLVRRLRQRPARRAGELSLKCAMEFPNSVFLCEPARVRERALVDRGLHSPTPLATSGC